MHCELIDVMGDDLRVANAARVSFSKEHKEFQENDGKLIQYLANHNHWTPFSHACITLRETVPIFVARQRFKHTVGFSYNEVSRRYVDDKPEFFYPSAWRGRPTNAKQGSEGIIDAEEIDEQYGAAIEQCVNAYEIMLEYGVAPEQARMVLPQSMYTSYYVTGSLAAWARAFNLRSDPHAQLEIQELAKLWDSIIQPLFPHSWKALTHD